MACSNSVHWFIMPDFVSCCWCGLHIHTITCTIMLYIYARTSVHMACHASICPWLPQHELNHCLTKTNVNACNYYQRFKVQLKLMSIIIIEVQNSTHSTLWHVQIQSIGSSNARFCLMLLVWATYTHNNMHHIMLYIYARTVKKCM